MFIHLGYMRCGTNFLRDKVFSLYDGEFVSNELFSGNPAYPLRDGIEFRDMILRGLYDYYGDVKIILCVRDEKSWVKSLYQQYVRSGFFYGYNKWYNNIFDERFLDYYDYVFKIKDLFNNVFIFNLDDFNLSELCDFIGVDYDKVDLCKVNRSITGSMIEIMRFYNFFRHFYYYLYENKLKVDGK